MIRRPAITGVEVVALGQSPSAHGVPELFGDFELVHVVCIEINGVDRPFTRDAFVKRVAHLERPGWNKDHAGRDRYPKHVLHSSGVNNVHVTIVVKVEGNASITDIDSRPRKTFGERSVVTEVKH